MAAVAESLEPAITRRRPEDDAQRQRVVWNRRVAISYALDTAFLFLFAMAGTISGGIPVIFGVISIAICAGNHVAIMTGWNLKAHDPSFTEQLTILSIANHLGVVAVAPQIAFPFLVNLFTVFAVGMIWLSLRDSLVVWALGAAGVATMLYFVEGQIGIPTSTSFELLLVWAYFSLILGRCLLLSMHSNMLRARLASSRRELAASLEQVRTLASHDELTGILNRRALMSALERERSQSERSGAPFSVAMIDLDHFKRINDQYGHAVGDEVLRAVAATITDTMRTTDVFGRYGGEEFAMILVGSASPLALNGMERIRATLAGKTWPAIAPELKMTLSAGIAGYRKGETIESLLHRADQALYQAKDAGRNTIVADPA